MRKPRAKIRSALSAWRDNATKLSRAPLAFGPTTTSTLATCPAASTRTLAKPSPAARTTPSVTKTTDGSLLLNIASRDRSRTKPLAKRCCTSNCCRPLAAKTISAGKTRIGSAWASDAWPSATSLNQHRKNAHATSPRNRFSEKQNTPSCPKTMPPPPPTQPRDCQN